MLLNANITFFCLQSSQERAFGLSQPKSQSSLEFRISAKVCPCDNPECQQQKFNACYDPGSYADSQIWTMNGIYLYQLSYQHYGFNQIQTTDCETETPPLEDTLALRANGQKE